MSISKILKTLLLTAVFAIDLLTLLYIVVMFATTDNIYLSHDVGILITEGVFVALAAAGAILVIHFLRDDMNRVCGIVMTVTVVIFITALMTAIYCPSANIKRGSVYYFMAGFPSILPILAIGFTVLVSLLSKEKAPAKNAKKKKKK